MNKCPKCGRATPEFYGTCQHCYVSPVIPEKPPITLKTYPLIERAVEEGLMMGWKNTQSASPEAIQESMKREVMNALAEIINFGGEQ